VTSVVTGVMRCSVYQFNYTLCYLLTVRRSAACTATSRCRLCTTCYMTRSIAKRGTLTFSRDRRSAALMPTMTSATMQVRACVCVCVCVSVSVHSFVSTAVRVCVHVCVYVCVSVSVCVCNWWNSRQHGCRTLEDEAVNCVHGRVNIDSLHIVSRYHLCVPLSC